ncbi:MAG: hypothetical protein HY706_07200 [Candidatus Hydrogenedentes bacterium]|nr:hypothetical protein [Candidatus Hydrogenedentota bacterium]
MTSNVYILGAGVSRAAGLPLMDDFFVMAKQFLENSGSGLGSQDIGGVYENTALQEIFSYVASHAGTFYEKNWNPLNIEHVYSVLDSEISSNSVPTDGRKTLVQLRRYLRYTIVRIFEIAEFNGRNSLPLAILRGRRESATIYAAFAATLRPQDTVISFNYDLLVDRGLVSVGLRPDYVLSADPIHHVNGPWCSDRPARRLLKVHGSANWMICGRDECEGMHVHTDVFNNTSAHVNDDHCHVCHRDNSLLDYLIVPPTTAKRPSDERLQKIMISAIESLRTATQVFIIGFSCPMTDEGDATFGRLVREGMHNNSHSPHVIVVNPDYGHAKRVQERVRTYTDHKICPCLITSTASCASRGKFEHFLNSAEGHCLMGMME